MRKLQFKLLSFVGIFLALFAGLAVASTDQAIDQLSLETSAVSAIESVPGIHDSNSSWMVRHAKLMPESLGEPFRATIA